MHFTSIHSRALQGNALYELRYILQVIRDLAVSLCNIERFDYAFSLPCGRVTRRDC